jgi:hypothetical protein
MALVTGAVGLPKGNAALFNAQEGFTGLRVGFIYETGYLTNHATRSSGDTELQFSQVTSRLKI